MSVMPALLAERLGIPQLSGARKLTVEGGTAKIERQTDGGYWAVEAPLPAIVSTWDTINEPRYPSFKGIMAAKKKPVETKSLADLGRRRRQRGPGERRPPRCSTSPAARPRARA